MEDGLETLYTWVRMTREPLMRALNALDPARYRAPQATLAGDSIRDRHVHMAQCYIHWVARVGLGEQVENPRPEAFLEPAATRAVFAQADAAVARLLERHAGGLDETFLARSGDFTGPFSARWLVAHPITHEFHHKGQIVVVMRLFGVEVGDTDLIYPFDAPAAP